MYFNVSFFDVANFILVFLNQCYKQCQRSRPRKDVKLKLEEQSELKNWFRLIHAVAMVRVLYDITTNATQQSAPSSAIGARKAYLKQSCKRAD